MEIKYLPALEEPKAVEFNFEEIKKELVSNLEKYKNLVVTAESIQDAKKTKAKLNHFKTVVDEERKRVKRVYEEPYRAIEPKFKELYNLIDAPVMAIDEQIKSYEKSELQNKIEKIKEFYSKNIGNLESIVPFEKIYQKEWNNKTVSLKKVETQMSEIINGIKTDLETIDTIESEFKTELRTTYLEEFNLVAVLEKKRKLEGQKKYEETIKAEQEEKQEKQETEFEEIYYTRDFRVTATKTQLKALSDFLVENKIIFGAVPKAKEEKALA